MDAINLHDSGPHSSGRRLGNGQAHNTRPLPGITRVHVGRAEENVAGIHDGEM